MADRCDKCRFWEGHGSADGDDIGLCQRLPPYLATTEAIRDWFCAPNGDCDADNPGVRGVWPVTKAFDWCGEYQAKEEAAE